MGIFAELVQEETNQKELLGSKEVKKFTSKEGKKEVKKFTSKELSNETNINVNFEDTKEVEKLVKYSTYLPPSLIKKIRVDSAISELDQQSIIRKILETHYNKKF